LGDLGRRCEVRLGEIAKKLKSNGKKIKVIGEMAKKQRQ